MPEINQDPIPQTEIPLQATETLNEAEISGVLFLASHPDINIHLHLTRHGSADHLGNEASFEIPLGKSDVFAMENKKHHPDEQAALDAVSRQEFSDELIDASVDSAGARQLKAVSKTGVRAIITDISSGHRLAFEPGMEELLPKLGSKYFEHGEDAHHPEVEELATTIAKHETAREWVVLAEFGKKLKQLSASDPEIAQKLEAGRLDVFMNFGDTHTGLFHKLRQLGLKPERSFSEMPVSYNFLLSIVRQKMLEKARFSK